MFPIASVRNITDLLAHHIKCKCIFFRLVLNILYIYILCVYIFQKKMLVEELSFFIIDNRVKVIGIERFCFFQSCSSMDADF